MVKNSAILFSPDDATPPAALTEWLARQADVVLKVSQVDELMAMSLRGRPRLVAFDARTDPDPVYAACRRLKRDSYTGVVPSVVYRIVAIGSGTWSRTATNASILPDPGMAMGVGTEPSHDTYVPAEI